MISSSVADEKRFREAYVSCSQSFSGLHSPLSVRIHPVHKVLMPWPISKNGSLVRAHLQEKMMIMGFAI